MQIIANGSVEGLVLALLGLAFLLVYIPTRIFHLALGGVFAIVPFMVLACVQIGFPWPLSLSLSVGTAIGLSLLCEMANHSPLERKRASFGSHFISSLGIYIIITQCIAIIWGNEVKVLRIGVDAVLRVGNVVLTHAQALGAIVSLFLLAAFFWWLRFSRLGLKLRALGENSNECALRGFNVQRLRLLAFGISGFLCAVASLLVAFDRGFDPHGGLNVMLLAIIAAILGGKNSWLGAVLGGLILGLTRASVVWFLSARWQDAITFLVLASCLLFLPRGILGRKLRLEADA